MSFEIKELAKIKVKNPVLIEGLPGIGNVGKIAVDFMIDSLKAKKFIEVYSSSFPNSVFINENNLITLPKISLHYKKVKNKDLIFLAGDVQPIDERSCYEFCEIVLNIFKKFKGSEIITLGGIGLPKIPKDPRIFCTANNNNIIKKYKTKELNEKIFGTVGPIMGVTGLLVGLAEKYKIQSIALLAETFNYPGYLGLRGADQILKLLNKKFELKLNLKELEEEIDNIEGEIKMNAKRLNKDKVVEVEELLDEKTSYIG